MLILNWYPKFKRMDLLLYSESASVSQPANLERGIEMFHVSLNTSAMIAMRMTERQCRDNKDESVVNILKVPYIRHSQCSSKLGVVDPWQQFEMNLILRQIHIINLSNVIFVNTCYKKKVWTLRYYSSLPLLLCLKQTKRRFIKRSNTEHINKTVVKMYACVRVRKVFLVMYVRRESSHITILRLVRHLLRIRYSLILFQHLIT